MGRSRLRVRATPEVHGGDQESGAAAAHMIVCDARERVRRAKPASLEIVALGRQQPTCSSTAARISGRIPARCSSPGMLAILLPMVGVYGVMSWVVCQRTAEMGIRLALSAQPGRVGRKLAVQHSLPSSSAGSARSAGSEPHRVLHDGVADQQVRHRQHRRLPVRDGLPWAGHTGQGRGMVSAR